MDIKLKQTIVAMATAALGFAGACGGGSSEASSAEGGEETAGAEGSCSGEGSCGAGKKAGEAVDHATEGDVEGAAEDGVDAAAKATEGEGSCGEGSCG